MNMPDNARYASAYSYGALDRNACDCRHPHDLHYRHGCAAEDCTCAYVPPPPNVVEVFRLLNSAASKSEGWLR